MVLIGESEPSHLHYAQQRYQQQQQQHARYGNFENIILKRSAEIPYKYAAISTYFENSFFFILLEKMKVRLNRVHHFENIIFPRYHQHYEQQQQAVRYEDRYFEEETSAEREFLAALSGTRR